MKTFILLFAFFFASIQVWCQVSGDSAVVWSINVDGATMRRISVSPDGSFFVVISGKSTSDNAYIKIFSTLNGSYINGFQAHKESGTGIGFSSNGQYLATCSSSDTEIKVWKTSDWSLYKTFDAGMDANPMYVCFSHNNKFIATCAYNVGYKIWDFETGNPIKIIDTYLTDINNIPTPTTVEFSPNDSLLALSATQNAGRVFDFYHDTTILYSVEESRFAMFSKDGKKFIADYETKDGNGVSIYDIQSRELINKTPLTTGIHDADISSDNQYLAYNTGNSLDSLLIFDISQNKIKMELPFRSSYTKFIPNSHFLLIVALASHTITKLDIDKITDVNDPIQLSENNFMQITPNPSSDFINISYYNHRVHPTAILNDEIKIYNTIGEIAQSVAFQNYDSQQIDITSLPPGLYFVRYGSEYAKFIKE
jgi:WD40 repeat protein